MDLVSYLLLYIDFIIHFIKVIDNYLKQSRSLLD